MAYLRKFRGGKRITVPNEPSVEVVAFVVDLARSGMHDAADIRQKAFLAFPHFSQRVIDTAIGEAARRLLEQHK